MRRHATRLSGAGATFATLALESLLVAAAAFAIGMPDWNVAIAFLSSPRPTHDGAIATTEVLVWLLIVMVLAVDLREAYRASRNIAARVGSHRLRARMVLLAGVLVFVGGLVHQQVEGPQLCCGNPSEAVQLLR